MCISSDFGGIPIDQLVLSQYGNVYLGQLLSVLRFDHDDSSYFSFTKVMSNKVIFRMIFYDARAEYIISI